ncbi:hypothetical protein HPP92_023527 [Vanilla planifolia]|uniref:Uncharacterized protein n=1 Tax=Vanilla planifolia TaxID=51239 RepID=A0A835UAH4_VANPL|nr:hypothetical protein HPP92_023527 [Vanilla planifolia]
MHRVSSREGSFQGGRNGAELWKVQLGEEQEKEGRMLDRFWVFFGSELSREELAVRWMSTAGTSCCPPNGKAGKVLPTARTGLAEESVDPWANNKVVQDMVLRLRNGRMVRLVNYSGLTFQSKVKKVHCFILKTLHYGDTFSHQSHHVVLQVRSHLQFTVFFDQIPHRNLFSWNASVRRHKSGHLPRCAASSTLCQKVAFMEPVISGYASCDFGSEKAIDTFKLMLVPLPGDEAWAWVSHVFVGSPLRIMYSKAGVFGSGIAGFLMRWTKKCGSS